MLFDIFSCFNPPPPTDGEADLEKNYELQRVKRKRKAVDDEDESDKTSKDSRKVTLSDILIHSGCTCSER